jgi:hypothetical protein
LKLVPCDAPGHGRKFGKFIEYRTTYRVTGIACLSTTAVAAGRASWGRRSARSASFLKFQVPCGAPGIGAKCSDNPRRVEILTGAVAIFVRNMVSWISTLAPLLA